MISTFTISTWLKTTIGNFGRWCLDTLVASDVTPNQLTMVGLIMVSAQCIAYVITHDTFWLGVGLSLSYTFDSLDGAVARRQGRVSKFGGYLDAVIDRYQELVAYLAIGYVTGWWMVVFLAMTGSMLISYNKARAAIEIPIDNKGWPDLLDRPRRIWLLCASLILDSGITVPEALGGSFLYLAIGLIAILTHFTAIQRFFRVRRMLVDENETAP